MKSREYSGKPHPDDHVQTMASYHCNFMGCSVRYDHMNGYFTVVNAPERPFLVEEPGANPLQCARHGTWLYRCEDDAKRFRFCVAVWRERT